MIWSEEAGARDRTPCSLRALVVPSALSLLVYHHLYANVKGLDAFPKKDWPDNIALLHYSYHVMAGLGTILLGVMAFALVWLWRGRLFTATGYCGF